MLKKSLPLTGTGDETRDFTYVLDLVQGLIKAAFYEDKKWSYNYKRQFPHRSLKRTINSKRSEKPDDRLRTPQDSKEHPAEINNSVLGHDRLPPNLSANDLNPANSLCEAMGGGKERVGPGCTALGASLTAFFPETFLPRSRCFRAEMP